MKHVSPKAVLMPLLLLPALYFTTPALAADSEAPAAKEEKGWFDVLKFWDDNKKAAAAPEKPPTEKPSAAKPEAVEEEVQPALKASNETESDPTKEKGWLDKFKFWGNDDDGKKKPASNAAKPIPKALPAVKPRTDLHMEPVVNLPAIPEPESEATPADSAPAASSLPKRIAIPKPKAAQVEVKPVDRIIAVVDNNVITSNELQSRIDTLLAQLEKQGTAIPPRDVVQKQVLERLILERLQLQLASQTGLRVDDNQLDKTLERIAAQNKLTLPEFRDALEKDGVRYGKFREDIRREITLARLKEREVDNRLTITDAEIDNLLTTQSARKDSDEFELSHILIRAPESGSPEELQRLRAKAEEALAKLQSGTDFAQVSARYSDAPNALEGGSLGWKASTQLPDLFVDAVRSLKVGGVTPILRSPNGFHIIKVTDRRGGMSPLVVQQTHVRHILVKTSEIVADQDALHRLDDLKERIDNGGNFEELARLHSEDPSSNKGGDLGWVNPGDMVPEFEKAMNDLKAGETSEPVHTPFGWHLIQVLERREQDMTKEAARLKARQEIKARKSDEAYQDWLRELRDRAFVEYHLEDKD